MSNANPTEVVVRITEREGPLGRLRAILRKMDSDNPHPQDVEAVRALLRESPELARIVCNVVEVNATKVIESLVVGALGREALGATVRTMRAELGYREAPALEQGLIDVVVQCWLRLQQVEHSYTGFLTQGVVIAQAEWCERRLTAAHGRYLRACESLARVRRLTRPGAVQINVGDQQVNVAGVVVGE